MDNCSAQIAAFESDLCRGFDLLSEYFVLLLVHMHLLDFVNSVSVGNVGF